MEIKISQVGVKTSTFSLLKENVVIGRDETCDVIIDHPDISEKHLLISEDKEGRVKLKNLTEAEKTLINEVEIQQNEEIEFTTFFPAQLGKNFTIELLNMTENERKTCVMVLNKSVRFNDSPDNHGHSQKPSSQKTLTSHKIPTPSAALNSQKTSSSIKLPIPSKKFDELDDDFADSESEKPKKNSNLVYILAACIIGIAVYYYSTENSTPVGNQQVKQTEVTPTPDQQYQAQATEVPPTPTATLTSLIEAIQSNPYDFIIKEKCLSPKEKEFCDYLSSARNTDYYEGALFNDGVLLITINREMGATFVNNQLEITPEIKEMLKDTARKAMVEQFKTSGFPDKELFDAIQKQVTILETDNNYKVYTLPEGKMSQLMMSYYLLHQDMAKKLVGKNYIQKIVGLSFNRRNGQPNATAMLVLNLNKLQQGVNYDTLKQVLAKGFISGAFEDFEREMKPYFENIVDYAQGPTLYEGPNPLENNQMANNEAGTSSTATATGAAIYYSPGANNY